jgi:PAS domain S-box-containing protein
MKLPDRSIKNISAILTGIISLIIAVSIPTAYFIFAYQYTVGSINTEMAYSAQIIEALVAKNPNSWQFEELRLQEILERHLDYPDPENRTIIDLQGQVIAETKEPLARPVVTFRRFIYDSGREVAQIEIGRSIAPLVRRTSVLGLFSALMAVLIFLVFYYFPLRKVRESSDQLQENEQRLVLALKSGHYGVLDWDIKRNVMIWDDKMYEIYGAPKDTVQISVEAWQSFVHREDRERFVTDIRPEVMGDRGYNTKFRIVKPDGVVRYIKADGIVLRDDDGNPSRFISLNKDITERKLAEDALRASEERFKSIVSTSKEWIWATNANGIHTFSNLAVEDILGYNPDEIIKSSTLTSIIHEEDFPKRKELLHQCIQQKTGWSASVIRWKHRDGNYRYLESCAVPILDSAGVLHGFQGSDRDITARKQADEEKRSLEDRLNRAEKMEALGQLAGGVAHDLNNVLGILSGYSELLLMDIPEGQQARSHAEKIFQSTEKGAAIIQDLLTLARRLCRNSFYGIIITHSLTTEY